MRGKLKPIAALRLRAKDAERIDREDRIAWLARQLYAHYWPLITTDDTDRELADNCFGAAEAFDALAEERRKALTRSLKRKKP